MRLRFSRFHFASLFCFAAMASVFAGNSALGQQVQAPNTKPNTLRLGDPRGDAKPAESRDETSPPPALDLSKQQSESEETKQSAESEIPIGSERMRLVSGTDEREALFAVELTAADNHEETERASLLALKIATASMSHVSPFFWWMAETASNFEVEADAPEVLAQETITQETLGQEEPSIAMEMADESIADVRLSEPPRMIEIAEEPSQESSLRIVGNGSADDVVEPNPSMTKVDLAPRKPAPRAVRIPFEDKTEVAKPTTKGIGGANTNSNRQQDSQKNQEEPALDPRSKSNEREQQGIDALNASKPGVHRREIRIDDPSNEGLKVAPIVQSKPLDPVLAKRLQRTEACLDFYLNNPESTSVRSPWAVMHAVLAFGSEYEMVHGKGRVNAIGWMCHNGTCRTQRMFTPNGMGFKPNVGDGVQGHEGQFLAILAQSNVPLNYPIQIGTAKYTVEDLVRYEMATCKEKSELTFKLIGLSYYLDSNKQWRAHDGKTWTIQKLIQEEMAQPIVGAACGGVHRLMGFSFSVRQRQLQGQPVNGQYARAAKFVQDYIAYTWQLQNPDGSFSTNWYEGRGNEPSDERKVQTSGHMLEWLMYTLSDEEIKNPRVGKAIDFLLSKIYDKRDHKWPIGPRGHATRAVALYQARTKAVLSKPSFAAPISSAAKTSPSVRK